MRWCCTAFREAWEEAGQRGFGVFVASLEPEWNVFVLQHRSIEPGDRVTFESSLPVSLAWISTEGR